MPQEIFSHHAATDHTSPVKPVPTPPLPPPNVSGTKTRQQAVRRSHQVKEGFFTVYPVFELNFTTLFSVAFLLLDRPQEFFLLAMQALPSIGRDLPRWNDFFYSKETRWFEMNIAACSYKSASMMPRWWVRFGVAAFFRRVCFEVSTIFKITLEWMCAGQGRNFFRAILILEYNRTPSFFSKDLRKKD